MIHHSPRARARWVTSLALLVGLTGLSGCGSGDLPPQGQLKPGEQITLGKEEPAVSKSGKFEARSIKNRPRPGAQP